MKIIICGGGTAGWLAALMISKIQTHSHDITVIESSKIGIVGAGEGSTGYLTDIIQGNNWDYGCNEEDFFRETNATVKLGIQHKDWRHKGFDYIAPIDNSAGQSRIDYMTLHAIANDLPFHKSSLDGYCIDQHKSGFYYDEDGKLTNLRSHAYHFDAHLVGKYFKKICGESIHHIDSEISDVNINDSGDITSVLLSNGQQVDGDFFIDCTGFSRLLAKKLKVNWISYSKHLPVNRAMPFILDHKEDEKILPVTTAWAQSAGWMWMIPTQARYGCGYVYCSDFMSDDDAKREIETTLGQEIEPIRVLKFDTGRQEVLWKNNCLFLGLCAAFAEPLEATSIHSTIVQLQSFIFEYLKDDKSSTCNSGFTALYNRRMSAMYDDFKDFLNIHYMTDRLDSNFWKHMTSGEATTENTKIILEVQKNKSLQPTDFNQYYGSAGAGLYNWVLAGLGKLTKGIAVQDLKFYGSIDHAILTWDIHQYNFEKMCKNMIDNTDFIKNNGKYFSGNILP